MKGQKRNSKEQGNLNSYYIKKKVVVTDNSETENVEVEDNIQEEMERIIPEVEDIISTDECSAVSTCEDPQEVSSGKSKYVKPKRGDSSGQRPMVVYI